MLMKWITFGIAKSKHAYFRNVYDLLDFVIVIIAWISVFISISGSEGNISAFKALRALRILRIFAKFETMRVRTT